MAEYQLTANPDLVIRFVDQMWIPNDLANRDWVEYQNWLAAGGVPDPYVPPEPIPDVPTPGEEVAFDHENRIRALEGQPPLSQGEFGQMVGKK